MSTKRGLNKYQITITALALVSVGFLVIAIYCFNKYSEESTKIPQLRAQYAGHLYLLNRCLDDGKSREFCNNLNVSVWHSSGVHGVDGWLVSAANTATDEFYGISVRVDYLPGQKFDELPRGFSDFGRDSQQRE